LTNVDDLIEKMLWAYKNPEPVKEMTERAFKWVQGLTWTKVVEHWDKTFLKVFNELEKDRGIANALKTAGRNDPCPCGSGEKFKKCHGGANANPFKEWIEQKDAPLPKGDVTDKPAMI
jgi:hypothetical protein